MSEPTEPAPPTSAAPSGTAAGTARYSVPEVARLLGISERAVRKRIAAGDVRITGLIHESGHQAGIVAAEPSEPPQPAWRRLWRRVTGG
jgi:hypothetical protein